MMVERLRARPAGKTPRLLAGEDAAPSIHADDIRSPRMVFLFEERFRAIPRGRPLRATGHGPFPPCQNETRFKRPKGP